MHFVKCLTGCLRRNRSWNVWLIVFKWQLRGLWFCDFSLDLRRMKADHRSWQTNNAWSRTCGLTKPLEGTRLLAGGATRLGELKASGLSLRLTFPTQPEHSCRVHMILVVFSFFSLHSRNPGKGLRDPAWLALSPMRSGGQVWLLSLDHDVGVVEGSFQNEEDCCPLKKMSVEQRKVRCSPHTELCALGKPK